jgi:hypothetical protein
MIAYFSVDKNRNLVLSRPHAAASGYAIQQLVYLACSSLVTRYQYVNTVEGWLPLQHVQGTKPGAENIQVYQTSL